MFVLRIEFNFESGSDINCKAFDVSKIIEKRVNLSAAEVHEKQILKTNMLFEQNVNSNIDYT